MLRRIADGDPLAFHECLDRYGALVWSLARRLSRTPTDAEDATQDIFSHIWRHASQYDVMQGSDRTLIAIISRRFLIERLRRGGNEPVTAAMATEALEFVAGPKPQDSLDLSLETDLAIQALSQLRPEYKRVLELAFLYGLSQRQIAQRLAMPLGTVKCYARRGLLGLRQCFKGLRPSRIDRIQ